MLEVCSRCIVLCADFNFSFVIMMPMLTILVIEKKQFNFQLPDSKWLIRLFEKFNVTFIDRYIVAS